MSEERRTAELLVVGTFGGGGIHHYIEEQCRQLEGRLRISRHDMVMAPDGGGLRWFLASLVLALGAAARFPFRSRPDVVHVHTSHRFSFYRSSFYVLFAAYVWDRPVVLHVHGSSFDEFVESSGLLVGLLQSAVFGASDRIIVLSEYWCDVLGGYVDEGKLRVVPNAVEVDAFDPAASDVPTVVFISGLLERKGVPELIDAVDRLNEAGDVEFRVRIAGKGELSEAVSALAERRENVEYLGYVSETEKRRLLEEGTVFALPTHAEGLPIAMLEGMAAGDAIVSTAVGSIPEVISEDNGTVVEPGDTDALTDALETLLTSPETATEMGRRNRRLVAERYTWETAAERLVDVYRELFPTPDGAARPEADAATDGRA